MSDKTTEKSNAGTQRPKIELPFARRRGDAGEWAFDHRIGLLVTIMALLMMAIVFVSSKILVGGRHNAKIIYIEMEPPPRVDMPERSASQGGSFDDLSDVRNRVSNENAAGGDLRDSKGNNGNEIYREAAAAQGRTAANREAYERGLIEARATGARQNADQGGAQGSRGEDTRVKGRVTASFSLVDPLRTSVRLHIPSYRCQGGGEVVVVIGVNRNGAVVQASVDRRLSSSDNCLTEMAVEAAHNSRFNLDASAPEVQRGTISYIFIPQ